MSDETLRYPVGKFKPQAEYSIEDIKRNIHIIQNFPDQLDGALKNCTRIQLDTPYREGGWTIRQVVHHLADSHMNAYIRIKWALTEETPTIKAYDEKRWAGTPENKSDPLLSITLLKALHAKWVELLNNLSASDFKKKFIHPDSGKEVPMDRQIAIYAWHGQHHLGHVKLVVK